MNNKETDSGNKAIKSLPPAVKPAYRPEPRPLKAGSLRQVEGRPGAYAYRDVPSMMGGQRVPYVSRLIVIDGITGNE